MVKKIIGVVVFLMVMSVSLSVFALQIGSQQVDITLSEVFVSRYIWRGQDLLSENDGALQPSIDILFPGLVSGMDLNVNLWGSFALDGGHQASEELDYTISLSRDVFESVTLGVGFTYFDYPNAGSTSDVSEPWLSLDFSNIIPGLPIEIGASLFVAYDLQAESGGPDEGLYYSWGFGTELPLSKCALTQEGQALALGITNWGNDGVADLKKSVLYATDLSVSTSYAVGGFSISPSINYTINHEDEINSGDSEFWTGIELSYAF